MSTKPFFRIKKTHSRRYPLVLGADHERKGPYYLIDVSGYGVSWREPAIEVRPTGEISTNPNQGNPYKRYKTWIPIFNRANLAFNLTEGDDAITAKIAKKIADETYKKLGNNADPAHAERFAWHLLGKDVRSTSKS